MAIDDPKTLVSTKWLAAHLSDPDLRVIDASWYLPDLKRDPRSEYEENHIPGARFFDIDDISDTMLIFIQSKTMLIFFTSPDLL